MWQIWGRRTLSSILQGSSCLSPVLLAGISHPFIGTYRIESELRLYFLAEASKLPGRTISQSWWNLGKGLGPSLHLRKRANPWHWKDCTHPNWCQDSPKFEFYCLWTCKHWPYRSLSSRLPLSDWVPRVCWEGWTFLRIFFPVEQYWFLLFKFF